MSRFTAHEGKLARRLSSGLWAELGHYWSSPGFLLTIEGPLPASGEEFIACAEISPEGQIGKLKLDDSDLPEEKAAALPGIARALIEEALEGEDPSELFETAEFIRLDQAERSSAGSLTKLEKQLEVARVNLEEGREALSFATRFRRQHERTLSGGARILAARLGLEVSAEIGR